MSSLSALDSLLGASSSGIDLSSILEAAYGASSPGIDVTSAVSAAVTAARAPEQAWENEEATLQSQVSGLTQIQTDATNLDNDVQALNSLTGPFSASTVTSSDSSVVSASAAAGTVAGNHVVVVNNLATTASWVSGTYASSSTAVPAGSFTITTGSGSSATITTDGTQTLASVASQINGDNLGVTASVVTDASGARLAITANASGSASNFSVSPSGSSALGLAQAVTGTNASLTVDGISISSASNTVTNAIPGISLNLLSANPSEQVSLQVAPDISQATTAINQFVSDYNTVITDLSNQFAFSGSSQGVLADDSTVRNLQTDVLGALDYTATPASGSTTVPNLSSMGITVNNDGTLTVNSSALQSSLQNNFSDVQNFFQGTSLNGFANTLDQQLQSFISSDNGAFTVDLSTMNTQISGLQTDVSNFEANYITPLQAQLQSEYSSAEVALQQLPSEMQQINAELGGNNSSN
jgi:flagellar hook-associated protein 2